MFWVFIFLTRDIITAFRRQFPLTGNPSLFCFRLSLGLSRGFGISLDLIYNGLGFICIAMDFLAGAIAASCALWALETQSAYCPV